MRTNMAARARRVGASAFLKVKRMADLNREIAGRQNDWRRMAVKEVPLVEGDIVQRKREGVCVVETPGVIVLVHCLPFEIECCLKDVAFIR